MTEINKSIQSIILAALIGSGFAVVWVLFGVWAVSLTAPHFFERGNIVGGSRIELGFELDGTPVVMRMHSDRGGARAERKTGGREEYTDEDGKPVKYWNGVDLLDGAWFSGLDESSAWDVLWSRRILAFLDMHHPPDFWYFVHDGKKDGNGFFVGYHSRSNELLGYIGKNGFSPEKPLEAERFPVTPSGWDFIHRFATTQSNFYSPHYPNIGRYRNSDMRGFDRRVYFQSGNTVYLVDFRNRSVQKVYESSHEPILSLRPFILRFDGPVTGAAAVRTEKRVVFLKLNGDVESEWILPEDIRNEKSIRFYRSKEGAAFATTSSRVVKGRLSYSIMHIWRFDEEGEVLSTRDIRLHTFKRGVEEEVPVILSVVGPLVSEFTLLAMAPAFAWLDGKGNTVGEAIAAAWREAGRPVISLIVIHIIGALLAWVCYRRQIRYGQSKGQVRLWTAFVFCFGLPGYVGYLAHRNWPVLETCTKCTDAVPVDRESCAVCGADFATPERNGTEVIA